MFLHSKYPKPLQNHHIWVWCSLRFSTFFGENWPTPSIFPPCLGGSLFWIFARGLLVWKGLLLGGLFGGGQINLKEKKYILEHLPHLIYKKVTISKERERMKFSIFLPKKMSFLRIFRSKKNNTITTTTTKHVFFVDVFETPGIFREKGKKKCIFKNRHVF